MSPDYRLIAVTAPGRHPGISIVDAGRAAAAGGATSLQVRLKAATAREMLDVTEQLLRVVDVPVYVNDRVDVARVAGAHGVHLGADDLPTDRIWAATQGSLRVGLSVGSEAEAADARAAPAHYWSLGPFHRTGTKADAGVPLGEVGFRRLAAMAPSSIPVIAIGGIRLRDVAHVIAAGAQGVAVIGAVFGDPDIETATRAIRDELDACLP